MKLNIETINNHCVVVYDEPKEKNPLKLWSATVFSYDTPVMRQNIDGTFSRLWDGWSITTQRDINRALGTNIDKKTWDAMPVVD